MLSRDECENALEYAKINYIIEDSIGHIYHFQNTRYCMMLENLIKEHFESQAYKFEDLKPNLWVWDSENNECILIDFIKDNRIYFYSVGYEVSFYHYFEENRFYPVHMANRKEV